VKTWVLMRIETLFIVHNILLVYLFDPQASLHDVSIVMFLSYPALKELDMI